ncbi:MAG: GAF domain-containing protein [Sulfurimonadaceae bacterium]|nr:GAF domain-containing protein [Sulfurimonadaceae bacterium]
MSKEIYKKIAEFGKTLATQNDIDNALELIAEEAKKLLEVERCSIFIVDKEAMMLWTKHSDGIGRIAIGIDSGIAGDTYKTQEPQLVNNPYEDDRFLPKIDEKSGFTTRNILTVPIFDSKREVIGVIQLLNKSEGEFSQEDLDILTFLANYVSGTIELVLMVES